MNSVLFLRRHDVGHGDTNFRPAEPPGIGEQIEMILQITPGTTQQVRRLSQVQMLTELAAFNQLPQDSLIVIGHNEELFGEVLTVAKENGRVLLTPHNRHANAYTGTLSGTPGLGVPRTVSCDTNFAFCCGQQPKPQIVIVGNFYICFVRAITIESKGVGQCKNC